jgi:hypothetical protein
MFCAFIKIIVFIELLYMPIPILYPKCVSNYVILNLYKLQLVTRVKTILLKRAVLTKDFTRLDSDTRR